MVRARGVLILKDSVWPTFTLIDVAKPWIVESPAPLTCQSLAGSPGSVFSQAITLTTGGPQGPAAAAGRVLTRENKLTSTASIRLVTKRGDLSPRVRDPVPDIPVPPTKHVVLLPLRKTRKRYMQDAQVVHSGWQKLGHEMVTGTPIPV